MARLIFALIPAKKAFFCALLAGAEAVVLAPLLATLVTCVFFVCLCVEATLWVDFMRRLRDLFLDIGGVFFTLCGRCFLCFFDVILCSGVWSFLTFAFAIERLLFYRSVQLERYTHAKALELDLGKHLATIASIGVNAPYIGLLGTVLAIILTFYTIGTHHNNIHAGEIMKHLALALKATAMGLMVAIPATVLYNALLTKVDRLMAQWEILRDEGALKR